MAMFQSFGGSNAGAGTAPWARSGYVPPWSKKLEVGCELDHIRADQSGLHVQERELGRAHSDDPKVRLSR